MVDHPPDASAEERALHQLRVGATAELKLLRAEQKAERRLMEARAAMALDAARAEKARRRLDRRREDVAAAEAALLECQVRRAAGPDAPAG